MFALEISKDIAAILKKNVYLCDYVYRISEKKMNPHQLIALEGLTAQYGHAECLSILLEILYFLLLLFS